MSMYLLNRNIFSFTCTVVKIWLDQFQIKHMIYSRISKHLSVRNTPAILPKALTINLAMMMVLHFTSKSRQKKCLINSDNSLGYSLMSHSFRIASYYIWPTIILQPISLVAFAWVGYKMHMVYQEFRTRLTQTLVSTAQLPVWCKKADARTVNSNKPRLLRDHLTPNSGSLVASITKKCRNSAKTGDKRSV